MDDTRLDDIELTLRRIAAGARVIGAGWVGLLVLSSYLFFRAEMVSRWPPIATAVVVAAWAMVSVQWLHRDPDRVVATSTLAVDAVIASAAMAASVITGPGVPAFSGGVPLIVVAIAAIAGRRQAWTMAAAMIAVTAVVRPGGPSALVPSVVLYLAGSVSFGWVVQILRSSDALRRDAEDRRRSAEADRARAEERVEISRHLHDSVLQTLALVQRRDDVPPEVTVLVRRQERDLREWLFGAEPAPRSFSEAVRAAAADVERRFAVPVEVVSSGDAETTVPAAGLVAAAGEAMTNAARHSGADRIAVFTEVTEGSFSVFVRDRGTGFDPEAVPRERMGVRESIVGRMSSYGGSATVRSDPGFGTEWKLEVPR